MLLLLLLVIKCKCHLYSKNSISAINVGTLFLKLIVQHIFIFIPSIIFKCIFKLNIYIFY